MSTMRWSRELPNMSGMAWAWLPCIRRISPRSSSAWWAPPCSLTWREAGERERIWVTTPNHPIAEGLGSHFDLAFAWLHLFRYPERKMPMLWSRLWSIVLAFFVKTEWVGRFSRLFCSRTREKELVGLRPKIGPIEPDFRATDVSGEIRIIALMKVGLTKLLGH